MHKAEAPMVVISDRDEGIDQFTVWLECLAELLLKAAPPPMEYEKDWRGEPILSKPIHPAESAVARAEATEPEATRQRDEGNAPGNNYGN